MYFYDTNNINNNMTPEDELDERWDGNLGFYHPSDQNEQQKEIALDILLQQSLNLSQSLKEVSPPVSVKSDGSISTAYFKEELDENYFPCSKINSPVIEIDHTAATPLTTPPPIQIEKQDVDYLTTYKDDENEDLSIVALNDLSPNECVIVLNQQESQDAEFEQTENTHKPPASLTEYHLSLAHYYTDAILRKTDPHNIATNVIQSIESTLPTIYQNYIRSIKELCSVPYPCL